MKAKPELTREELIEEVHTLLDKTPSGNINTRVFTALTEAWQSYCQRKHRSTNDIPTVKGIASKLGLPLTATRMAIQRLRMDDKIQNVRRGVYIPTDFKYSKREVKPCAHDGGGS